MAIVVRWSEGGDYLESASVDDTGQHIEWAAEKRRAKRFESQTAFRKWTRDVGLKQKDEVPWWWDRLRFVRLVPKRRAEQATTDAVAHDIGKFIIENTTQKSMYAMNLAEHILWRLRHVHGFAPREAAPEKHTEIINGGVKVTAPVEMSLSEVWASLSSAPAFRVCLEGETRRAREQGAAETGKQAGALTSLWEARAENVGDTAEASRNPETKARFFSRADTYIVCAREVREAFGIEPPADAAGRALENREMLAPKAERATAKREQAQSGMRIERRGDGDWLVVTDDVNTCEEVPPGMSPDDWSMVCTHHFDGQHISCGKRDGCALKIDARWPITEASQ